MACHCDQYKFIMMYADHEMYQMTCNKIKISSKLIEHYRFNLKTSTNNQFLSFSLPLSLSVVPIFQHFSTYPSVFLYNGTQRNELCHAFIILTNSMRKYETFLRFLLLISDDLNFSCLSAYCWIP